MGIGNWMGSDLVKHCLCGDSELALFTHSKIAGRGKAADQWKLQAVIELKMKFIDRTRLTASRQSVNELHILGTFYRK